MVYQLSNPIVKSLITSLRDVNTDALRFKHIVMELSRFLVYEALKDIEMTPKVITTWKGEDTFASIKEEDIVFVTVLRAGMPMIEGLNNLFVSSPSGFLAMKRDEVTHKSKLYFDRVPDCKGKRVILVDPMVATGGSLCDAIELLKTKDPHSITTLNIIASPEGLSVVQKAYGDVDIYVAQIDKSLNDDKFILPGLGDAGDRSYNTL